jgi:hypothetical protein
MERFAAAILAVILIISAAAQAPQAASIKNDESTAENIVKAAFNSEKYVITLTGKVRANSTIIELINGSSLKNAFWGNLSLISDGSKLLGEAKAHLNIGNHTAAINKAMEAMEVFRGVWVNIHGMLRELNITEIESEPKVQAQGLLVAANRTIERIKRIENMSNNPDFKELLKKAINLLNDTEALLAQGNVSDVAHRLAEANHLTAQAYRMLKAKAEEEAAEKMERFRVKVMEQLEATAGKLNETSLREIIEEVGFRNMNEFKQALHNLTSEAIEELKAGKPSNAAEKLRSLNEKIKDFARRTTAKTAPSEGRSEKPSLELSIEKRVFKNHVELSVTVKNTGNCSITLPNAALGLVIERKTNGEWIRYYEPISAQVLITIEPGESREITIKITKPEQGIYRAKASGWTKTTQKQVTATSTEFNIP